MDNRITVSILTHRCQCPHDRLKRGGDRGGAINIHKRKLSSESHVKKRYKSRNHLFYTPGLWSNRRLNSYQTIIICRQHSHICHIRELRNKRSKLSVNIKFEFINLRKDLKKKHFLNFIASSLLTEIYF